LRAPGCLDGRRTGLFGARPRAAPRRGAEARRLPGGGGSGRPPPRHPSGLREGMIASLMVLLLGLGLAGVAAAIGVAAAAVSQVELTRWVHYKLRGTEAAVRLLEHPGRVLATANALTTLGVVVGAAAVPARRAQTPPTSPSATRCCPPRRPCRPPKASQPRTWPTSFPNRATAATPCTAARSTRSSESRTPSTCCASSRRIPCRYGR